MPPPPPPPACPFLPRPVPGKDAGQRSHTQRDWGEGALSVVVATVAFGMGIDRADVR